jgi:hypothetical protein
MNMPTIRTIRGKSQPCRSWAGGASGRVSRAGLVVALTSEDFDGDVGVRLSSRGLPQNPDRIAALLLWTFTVIAARGAIGCDERHHSFIPAQWPKGFTLPLRQPHPN